MTLPDLYAAMAGEDFNLLILVEVECLFGGVETPLRFSNRLYVDASDRVWDARLIGGVSFSARIDPVQLTGSTGFGDIEIDSRDQGLDYLAGAVWHGRLARVRAGDLSWQPDDCPVVASGHIERLAARSCGRFNLVWRDELARLDSPITKAKLGGDGPAKDRIVPLSFGEVFNVPALLVDAPQHCYKVHDGLIESVVESREAGAPVPNTADVASGEFKLLGTPIGDITCDVQGGKAGGWLSTVPGIVAHLATQRGDTFWRFSPAEVAPLPDLPQRVGLWVDSEMTVADAVRYLAQSVNAIPAIDSLGRLALTVVRASGTPVATLTAADIRKNTLTLMDSPVPAGRIKIGYGRNHAPRDGLGGDALGGGLPEASRTVLAAEYAYAEAVDAARVATWRLRDHAEPEDTALACESDAASIATERLALRGPALRLSGSVNIRLGWLRPGMWVILAHPQYGLTTGRDALVCAIDVDVLQQTVQLEFWLPWQP